MIELIAVIVSLSGSGILLWPIGLGRNEQRIKMSRDLRQHHRYRLKNASKEIKEAKGEIK